MIIFLGKFPRKAVCDTTLKEVEPLSEAYPRKVPPLKKLLTSPLVITHIVCH